MTGDTDLEDAVREELSEVLDPCSCSTDRPVNIVDMGLVEEVVVEGGDVHVSMLLTSQACMYFMNMSQEIENRLLDLPDVESVTVSQEREGLWTPDRMTDEEYEARREIFHEKIDAHGIEPYYSESST
jgi:metal-sulfur cluster biosynthetic enzyme